MVEEMLDTYADLFDGDLDGVAVALDNADKCSQNAVKNQYEQFAEK